MLRFGAKPSAYATLLLDLARNPGSAWTPATALSMARPSAIEGRLLSILADAVRDAAAIDALARGSRHRHDHHRDPRRAGGNAGRRLGAPPWLPRNRGRWCSPQMVMALDDKDEAESATDTLVGSLADDDRGRCASRRRWAWR